MTRGSGSCDGGVAASLPHSMCWASREAGKDTGQLLRLQFVNSATYTDSRAQHKHKR